jgi:hypothetical protein
MQDYRNESQRGEATRSHVPSSSTGPEWGEETSHPQYKNPNQYSAAAGSQTASSKAAGYSSL